jgi:Na+-transporting methylmalonyl-CoA/oxaloacetate decarboxylase beta subunit
MEPIEIDFGPTLADPKETLRGLIAVFGVEHTTLAFAEAVVEYRRLRAGELDAAHGFDTEAA